MGGSATVRPLPDFGLFTARAIIGLLQRPAARRCQDQRPAIQGRGFHPVAFPSQGPIGPACKASCPRRPSGAATPRRHPIITCLGGVPTIALRQFFNFYPLGVVPFNSRKALTTPSRSTPATSRHNYTRTGRRHKRSWLPPSGRNSIKVAAQGSQYRHTKKVGRRKWEEESNPLATRKFYQS